MLIFKSIYDFPELNSIVNVRPVIIDNWGSARSVIRILINGKWVEAEEDILHIDETHIRLPSSPENFPFHTKDIKPTEILTRLLANGFVGAYYDVDNYHLPILLHPEVGKIWLNGEKKETILYNIVGIKIIDEDGTQQRMQVHQ